MYKLYIIIMDHPLWNSVKVILYIVLSSLSLVVVVVYWAWVFDAGIKYPSFGKAATKNKYKRKMHILAVCLFVVGYKSVENVYSQIVSNCWISEFRYFRIFFF